MNKTCPMKTNEYGERPKECGTATCGWWCSAQEKCAILILAENSKPVKNLKIDIDKYDGSDL
jgi:hypothetical protein